MSDSMIQQDLSSRQLVNLIVERLYSHPLNYLKEDQISKRRLCRTRASVILLISVQPEHIHCKNSLVFLLNKRSERVRQPGDLCCPGGGIHRFLDTLLSRLLCLPLSPLRRSRGWQEMLKVCPQHATSLALYLAAALRESWEEIGLNPFLVEFLGPLPPYRLKLFRREILPVVGLIRFPTRLRPNWEVERIVYIPLSAFGDETRYAQYIVNVSDSLKDRVDEDPMHFSCFLYQDGVRAEILWGATYSIIMSFLKLVFDFTPPSGSELNVIRGNITPEYITGKQ